METLEDFYRRTGISQTPDERFAFVRIEPCGNVSGMSLDQMSYDLTSPPVGVPCARETLDVIRRGGRVVYLHVEEANRLPRCGSTDCACRVCRVADMPSFGIGDTLVVTRGRS